MSQKIRRLLVGIGVGIGVLFTISMGILWLFIFFRFLSRDIPLDRIPDWFIVSSWLFLFDICFLLVWRIAFNQKSQSRLLKRIIMAIILSFIVLVPGIFGMIGFQDSVEESKALHHSFENIIRETLQLDLVSLPVHTAMSSKGLLLILEGKYDSGWYSVSTRFDSSNLAIANSPEEVGAVAIIIKKEKIIRTYTPTGADAQYIFDCWVIDWNSKSVIAHDIFAGSVPGSSEGGAASSVTHYGSEPWHETEQWLFSLAH